jgi:antitoxin YefM
LYNGGAVNITLLLNKEAKMTFETTYSQARANFATLWDQIVQDRDVVIVQRRGTEAIAMIAADELTSLLETAHLLRSPKNAERLLSALGRALKDESQPQSLSELREIVGFDETT